MPYRNHDYDTDAIALLEERGIFVWTKPAFAPDGTIRGFYGRASRIGSPDAISTSRRPTRQSALRTILHQIIKLKL